MKALLIAAGALSLGTAFADVALPVIFSDHMVLAKTDKVPVWGKADPGEKVAVGLNDQMATAVAGQDGKWKVSLDLKKSEAGPFEMMVQGKNKIAITDVLVGEVWVAGGQSNMEFPINGFDLTLSINAPVEIAGSANPMLRQFKVEKAAVGAPTEELKGAWTIAGPETTGNFTAVGYYFGKALQKELKVPVAIINDNWGGTPVEAWTSPEAVASVPAMQEASDKAKRALVDYPLMREAYLKAFDAWAKETGRENKATSDPATYAAPGASTAGWTTVKLPGKISGEGLSSNGVIWLRRDITIPANFANKMVRLTLGQFDGLDTIYWNGDKVHETVNDPGPSMSRRFDIPAEQIKEGKATLAVRIYAPATPLEISNALTFGPMPLSGNWLARTETSFPPLDAEKLAAIPRSPGASPRSQVAPSFLYNGMINPLIPYGITGVIWYQGEANASRAYAYRSMFPLLIADWRQHWGQGNFPFYFCQLANYMNKKELPDESMWAELREAQSMTLKVPQTGQAILIEQGESGDIHPRNKKEAGERLARIAFNRTYGIKTPDSGPVYKSMSADDGKVRLKFGETAGGLVAAPLPETYVVQSKTDSTAPLVRNSPKSELEGFAICGEDHKWVWADAKIDGDTVVVSSPEVQKPVAVRYAWADNPTCNLFNKAGLPASPFRTDDFPGMTKSK